MYICSIGDIHQILNKLLLCTESIVPMPLYQIILFLFTAYLIGSIPTAIWLRKLFYETDVRRHGSGNAGATNTFRILGPKLGVPVLLIDILKGYLALQLLHLAPATLGSAGFTNFQLILGAGALIGHIYPVYAGFKGGKGIASLLGVMFAIHPQATLACLGIFSLVFYLSKIVSLSSMSAAMSFPFIIILVFRTENKVLAAFSVIIALLVLYTHRKNIIRILNGEEPKIKLNKQKSNNS